MNRQEFGQLMAALQKEFFLADGDRCKRPHRYLSYIYVSLCHPGDLIIRDLMRRCQLISAKIDSFDLLRLRCFGAQKNVVRENRSFLCYPSDLIIGDLTRRYQLISAKIDSFDLLRLRRFGAQKNVVRENRSFLCYSSDLIIGDLTWRYQLISAKIDSFG